MFIEVSSVYCESNSLWESHVSLNILCFFCQGIKARILETFVMLFLLALLILGIVWVASALIDNDAASMESLYGRFSEDTLRYARK